MAYIPFFAIVCYTIKEVPVAQFFFIQWLDDFLFLRLFSFDWDDGNKFKSIKKHGLTNEDVEEAFFDEHLVVLGIQILPKCVEERYGIIASTKSNQLLFVSFTIRSGLVRVISARNANKKEKESYES